MRRRGPSPRLRKDPELTTRGPQLTLLTLGANLPLIACHPRATALREDISRLAGEPGLYWLEYQSRLDLLNFPDFDPGRALAVPPLHDRQMNPTVHSARIRESMDPRSYLRNRWNFWRLHFQYLMAIDRLVPCDYMMIVAGPAPLELRGKEPMSAIRFCHADGTWPLETNELAPIVLLPPGRRK